MDTDKKTSADYAGFRGKNFLKQSALIREICGQNHFPSVVKDFFLLAVSGRNSRISPGWQSSVSQIASSVEKRMALALPVLRMDRFCGVMSTASARSFSRILRCARTTSRLTMMGINLNRQFLFLLNLPAFVHDPGDKQNQQAGNKRDKQTDQTV